MLKDLDRTWRSRPARWSTAAYTTAVLLMWPVPLLNVLHAESCAVLAGVGFLISGLSTLALLRRRVALAAIVAWQAGVLVLPLALMTVPVLWAPNCSYRTGLLIFVLFPCVSVFLAAALAYLIHSLEIRRPRTVFVSLALTVAVGAPLYDLGLFPQLYTYNHVFGGLLGPLYDEQLAIRPGLFAFRGLSLLWAVTLVLAGRLAVTRSGLRHPLTKAVLGCSIALIVAYALSARLGWNTTPGVIEEALGRSTASDHFVVYFDARSVAPDEIDGLVDEAEYRYDDLARRLEVEVGERIRLYLYPTAEMKGRLTGSRSTSVTPVWLRHPQIHMLRRRAGRSLNHELVHVFSREFGLPILRASPSVGLVEGLASALEAPDGRPSPADLMAAVIQDGTRDSLTVVSGLTSALGAFGFWTGRGAVSYAATGSFVRYLLKTYGSSAVKRVYRTGRFRSAIGKRRAELAADWYTAVLHSPPVSAAARPAAEEQFAVPSLFETECPHFFPRFVTDYRRGIDALSLRDTLAAVRLFEWSLGDNPQYLPARARLGAIRIRQGDHRWVLETIASDTVAMKYPRMMLLAADAHALAGGAHNALGLYNAVMERMPDYAVEVRLVLWMRRLLAADPGSARWFLTDAADDSAESRITDHGVGALLVAARALRRRDDEAACKALRAMPDLPDTLFPEVDAPAFAAQTLLWQAEVCNRSEFLELAAAAGNEAAVRFRALGERDLSLYAADRADLAHWKLSESEGRTSPTPMNLPADSSGR